MKKLSLLLCIIMCAALCSCGNEDKGDGTGHMYDAPLLGNPTSLDPQFANDAASNTVIKNLYSGLMEIDNNGRLVCRNAESYTVSDDGRVYTFKLRTDNYWFFDKNDNDVIEEDEYFQVTAPDYVFALQRVLDPEMRSPFAEDFMCISGAREVYIGAESVQTLGVIAGDSKTLIIALDEPNADLPRLMSTAPSFPCCKQFFDNTKGRYGLDDRSVMSNGAFFVRQWFYDPYGSNNILYMKRNDANWSETVDINPSFLSFTIEDSEDDIRELFKKDKIECFTTLNSSVYNPEKYSITSIPSITLGLLFNPDNYCYSNTNMHRALAMSIDRDAVAAELDTNDLMIARGVVPPAVALNNKSYREIVPDSEYGTYDPEAAKECYKKAKQELGVNSIDTVKIIVNGEMMNSSCLHTITQNWQEIFGSYIGIEEISAADFDRRVREGDYDIALYPLTGDDNSTLSVFRQFDRCKWLQHAAPEDKFTPMLTGCTSSEDYLRACRAVEKYLIDSCQFVPLFYKNTYLVADSENEQIYYDPFTGAVDYRLALNYD